MTHRPRFRWLSLALVLAAGCGSEGPTGNSTSAGGESDGEKVRSAEFSILFVGNSHTAGHGLPNLVGELIRFRHPERTVYSHHVWVGFLEDTANDPRARDEIESRPWKFVVLQAQKESKTGQLQYSQVEGIELAKRAKARGATVLFYSEWGLRDVPGHGPRIEQMYREMATASDSLVAPVGRAWELARADRPDLVLHDTDGNHQSAVGAFLTACVIAGRITGESPAELGDYPYAGAGESDRKFLADVAGRALAP